MPNRSPLAAGGAARALRFTAISRSISITALVALALAVAPTPARAYDYTLGNLRIEHPNARPTPPGARTGGAYFSVENVGKDADRLLRVASSAADTVELHSMRMEGNVMRMRAVTAIDIPPARKVTLGSGGYHVMLVGLKQPLALGDRVPLTLTFEKAGAIDVTAYVEAAKAGAAADAAHRH